MVAGQDVKSTSVTKRYGVSGGVGHDETGLLFQVRLPHPLGAATLSYKFKFDAGYDWTSGGKMPGLCDNGAALLL